MVTSNPNQAGTINFHKSVVPPGNKTISCAKTPAQQTKERKTICWQLHACIYSDHALKQYTNTNYLYIHIYSKAIANVGLRATSYIPCK